MCLKGMVHLKSMPRLRQMVKELLADRKNVALASDWNFLKRADVMKDRQRFTNGERDIIVSCHESMLVWKRKKERKLSNGKEATSV